MYVRVVQELHWALGSCRVVRELVFNVIEGGITIPAARLTADAVRGRVVIKRHASLIVGLALVIAAPVLLLLPSGRGGLR